MLSVFVLTEENVLQNIEEGTYRSITEALVLILRFFLINKNTGLSLNQSKERATFLSERKYFALA